MGWAFYDLKTLPDVHAIVWCKWPQREDKLAPGPIARPVLVRETRVMMTLDGQEYGALLVSYASGEGIDDASRRVDLVIESRLEITSAGLHKPTRFSLNPADRKLLPWCEEYFVAPEYVQNTHIVAGKLTDAQLQRMRECLTQRGLLS
jgi:hypothetical protein